MTIFQRRLELRDSTIAMSVLGGPDGAGNALRAAAQRLLEVGRGAIGRALDGSTEDFLRNVDQETGQ